MQSVQVNQNNTAFPQLLRLAQVSALTGLSRAAIYAKQNPKDKARFDPDFPQRIQLAPNAVAIRADELAAWLDKRIAERNRQIKQAAKGADV